MSLWGRRKPHKKPVRRKLTAKQFVKEAYREYVHDNVSDSAATLSYYFFFSLFPFLVFLATMTAYIPGVKTSVTTMLSRARAILPPQAMGIIDEHVKGLINQPRPKLLTIGIIVTLYSASRGVDAVRKALNLAYDVKESRPLWKTEGIAFGMTIGGALLVLLGVTALVAGGDLGLWLAERLDFAKEYVVIWSWARWPVTAGVIMLARGDRVLPLAGRRTGVPVHHAGLDLRNVGLARGDLGLQLLRRALRQLQRHVRLDRRRHRADDLALHQRIRVPDGRGDQRHPRGPQSRGQDAGRARAGRGAAAARGAAERDAAGRDQARQRRRGHAGRQGARPSSEAEHTVH